MKKTTINPSEIGKQLATQLGRPTVVTPKIIEEGKEIVRPDIIQAITQLGQLGQLTRIRKSIEKEEFEGKLDSRTLSATDQLQWVDLINRHPNTPWATAYFFNDGPNSVYITVNEKRPTTPINNGESLTLDFIKADRRIGLVYYWCDPGNTASVRAKAKY